MTIRVVQPQQQLYKYVTCDVCKSYLQYEQSDVGSHLLNDYFGGEYLKFNIVCPTCKSLVHVSRWEDDYD